jgi:hypothetical protein
MIAIIAVASLAPSIAINVAHALNDGGSWSLLILAVTSVIAAPICLAALPKVFADKRFDLAAGAACILLLSLAFNFSNAVGLAGGERDSRREGRESQIARVNKAEARLSKVQSFVADYRAIAGDGTPEMVDAELIGLRGDPVFSRSKNCADVTLPDSKAHCGKIAEALRRKGAAEQLRELERERRDLVAKLDGWGAAPSSPDAKVDRIASLLALMMPITKAGESWVGVGLDVVTALLIELLGAFLPPIAGVLLLPRPDKGPVMADKKPLVITESMPPMTMARPEKPRPATPGKSTHSKSPSGNVGSGDIPDGVRLFADRCLVRRVGANIRGNDLYAAYAADCRRSGMTPENIKRFGLAMAALGYAKDCKRVVTYRGVALKGIRPVLAAVAK